MQKDKAVRSSWVDDAGSVGGLGEVALTGPIANK